MAEKKPKKIIFTAVAAAVFLIAAALLIFIITGKDNTSLVLTDGDTGEEYVSYEVYEGMEFGVSFIHSVNKSEVYEIYEVKGDEIILMQCIYSAFGAGVATETEGDQTLEYTDDGKMIISNINRVMPRLSYIVGTVSDHILHIDGEEVSLRELCGRNSVVRFSIES